jgi:hypothetical protein
MSDTTVQRNASGQLLPGSRLNPGGRPARAIEDLRERLQSHLPKSVEVLAGLLMSKSETVRLAAVHEIFDRLVGRPAMTIDSTTTKLDIGQLYLQAVKLANQPATVDVTRADEPADRTKGPRDEW